MDKVQIRIGKLLSVFSIGLYVFKFITYLLLKEPLKLIIEIPNILYPILFVLFIITIYWKSSLSKLIQCFSILLCGLFSLNGGPNNSFFGLAMIILSIILFYTYGYYKKYTIAKLIISNIILYLIFSFVCLNGIDKNFIHVIEWLIFIDLFLFILWLIIRDFLEQLENKDIIEQNKLLELLDVLRKLAHDALDMCEKYKNKCNEASKGD